MVDPLADRLLHPHAAAACAAAKPSLVVALDLYQLHPRDRFRNLARRIVDVVPAAQEARVVIGELSVQGFLGLELPLPDQLGQ